MRAAEFDFRTDDFELVAFGEGDFEDFEKIDGAEENIHGVGFDFDGEVETAERVISRYFAEVHYRGVDIDDGGHVIARVLDQFDGFVGDGGEAS